MNWSLSLINLSYPSLLLQCPQRCFRCVTNSGCSQCRCRSRLTTMYHKMYQLKFRMGVQCLDSDKEDHSAPKSAVDWMLLEVPLACSLSLCRVSSKNTIESVIPTVKSGTPFSSPSAFICILWRDFLGLVSHSILEQLLSLREIAS